MKKILLTLLICSSLQIANSQSGWVWQNPLPQGNHLSSVQFLNANTGFIAGDAGCFMKTTNGGVNWNDSYFIGGFSSNGDNAPKSLRPLYFFNSLTGLVGTSSLFNLTYPFANKIMRTTDGGVSWDTVTHSNFPSFKTIFFANELTGWANCSFQGYVFNTDQSNTLLKTTDGGLNWFTQNLTLYSVSSSYFINTNTGWLAGYYSFSYPASGSAYYIYKTTDGGDNWVTQFYSTPGQVLNTVCFINENTGWAGGLNMLKTTNSGLTWEPTSFSANSIKFINNLTGYCVNNYGISKTTNAGDNWITQSQTAGNCISVADLNNATVVGKYGAIINTTNAGNNWMQYSSNAVSNPSVFYNVCFGNSLTGYIRRESGDSCLLKTTNGGLNWIVLKNPESMNVSGMSFYNGNTGWVTGAGKILKTTDGGYSWLTLLNIPSNSFGVIDFINQNTGWTEALNNAIYFTSNGGINWQNSITPVQHYFNDYIKLRDQNTGILIGGFGICRTTNSGNNWDVIDNNSYRSGTCDNANNLYAGTYSSFYKSSDFGLTWVLVNSSFPNNIESIRMVNSQIGFGCGLGGYITKTTDGGVSWGRQNSKFGFELRSIFFTDENTGWVVGDNGVILSTVDGGGNIVGINPIVSEIPNSYSLFQNYPNPFNPTTKIKFDVPAVRNGRDRSVTLIIYDILGREVTTLVNEQLKPGTYETEWDASNFASGLYFYKLQAGDYIETKKMVLIK